MKNVFQILLAFLLLLTGSLHSFAQYNKALADSLGADGYGMRKYFFVILKTGSYVEKDTQKLNTLFRGHMDNIIKLSKEGKLIVAGPLSKNENKYRGIFIFAYKTKEEVATALQADPAIKAHIFEPEIYDWYGSAALPAYLPVHRQIEQKTH